MYLHVEEHVSFLFDARRFVWHEGKKPFPPQLALMSKLLLGVRRGGNCLLESPTGTGKTLALLCAALAWQRDQKDNGPLLGNCDEEDVAHDEESELKAFERVHPKPSGELKSFEEFRYVDHNHTPSSATYGSNEEVAKGFIELAYDDRPTKPRVSGINEDDTSRWLDEQEHSVFQSPKRKRTKKISQGPRDSLVDDRMKDVTAKIKEEMTFTPIKGSRPFTGAELASSQTKTQNLEQSLLNAFRESNMNNTTSERTGTPMKAGANVEETTRKDSGVKKRRLRRRIPKIYFCSRTHSQLNQVVSELRACESSFRDTSAVGIGEGGHPFSMSLLGSRKNTCINSQVCKDPKGVDDACKRLLKDKGCHFQRRSMWAQAKLPPVWDVEELVKVGKENKTCPYYTARLSLASADLVLCPYNYLVDPGVREIMGIKLKNAVVIFDEAHNLEDSAREAASAKFSLGSLSNTAKEMQRLGAKIPSMAEAYDSLQEVVTGLQGFLEEADSGLPFDGYERAHKVYSGEEALGLIESRIGVTEASMSGLRDALDLVMNEDPRHDLKRTWGEELEFEQGNSDRAYAGVASSHILSSGAVGVIASIVKVLGFLFAKSMENVQHYKMVVLRERAPFETSMGARSQGRRGARGGNFGAVGACGRMETYLCFWCQSAGVCFSEIDKLVHSIILTSGTLSPLDSFAGELGIDFEHRLEAPHVINVAKQCLVNSVGFFGGVSLDSRFTNQHDLKYQDSLGNAFLQYARVVPGGMLAFFPSYGLMEKIYDRWKVTGFVAALDEVKTVFVEPRLQGKIDKVLSDYYEAVATGKELARNHSTCNKPQGRTGALMLAVARGKVSEGIDFSDDAARMCIIVGIPYPNSKDLQVMLKKEYQNHRRRRNPRLVEGGAWYNLQAFRAVNQAVGRCIRHRNDFGAIVLCDPRYSSKAEATASLSKWVRAGVRHCGTVETSLQQVGAFFSQHASDSLRSDTATSRQHGPNLGRGGEVIKSAHTSEDQCGEANRSNNETSGTVNCERKDQRHGKRRDSMASRTKGPVRPPLADRMLTPTSHLVQQTLSQVFASSSPETRTTPPLDSSYENSTQDSVDCAIGERSPIPVVTDFNTSKQPNRPGFYCRKSLGQDSASLALAPIENCESTSEGGDDSGDAQLPCLVTVWGGCHLYRIAVELECGDGDDKSSSVDVLEVPRGWRLEKCVSEGDGRWIAKDGLVYAPLYCKGKSGSLVHVGEKVIGAGLDGGHLIGRVWFFPRMVDVEGLGVSKSQGDLVFPTRIGS